METLHCSEVHNNNCSFIAQGATREEVLHQLSLHEEEMHKEDMATLTPQQQAEDEKIKRVHMGESLTIRDEEKKAQDEK